MSFCEMHHTQAYWNEVRWISRVVVDYDDYLRVISNHGQRLLPFAVVFILWRKTKSARTDILLTGLSDAGKTYLFSQWLFSEDKETFSSTAVNVGQFSSKQVCDDCTIFDCVLLHPSHVPTYLPTRICPFVCYIGDYAVFFFLLDIWVV